MKRRKRTSATTARAELTPLQKEREKALIDASVTKSDVARACKPPVHRQTATAAMRDKIVSERFAAAFAKLTGRDDLFPADPARHALNVDASLVSSSVE